MIILNGKTKSDAQALRTTLYNWFLTNGGQYPTDLPEFIEAMALIDNFCTKAGVNKNDYTFDFWSCAVFTKEEHRSGAIKAYRQQIGLIQ
jgi:hypothetical protein